jgi:hypothetical protein
MRCTVAMRRNVFAVDLLMIDVDEPEDPAKNLCDAVLRVANQNRSSFIVAFSTRS